MKKILWILTLLLAASLVLAACAPDEPEVVVEPEAEGFGEVTIAVENAYLPFNYIDPDTGEGTGWDYEIWDEICSMIGCTPVFVEAAWEGMIQAVADGQYDVAGDGITITEERAEIVDFSDGYVSIEQRLLVRIDEDRIESIDDIVANEELKLGTQTGTTNYATASQYLAEDRIEAFEQFPFAVQALIAGDIDAVIIDEVAGQGYLGENADALKLVGPSLSSDELGFIYPKGSELVDPVNEALLTLKGNGFMAELNKKYFGPDFDVSYDDLFPPEEPSFLACQVTDVGGIDDKSFNATAWKGMEDAVADLGIGAKYLESQQQTDYEVNINAFVEEGCDLIMSVGFLLGDATAAAAGANPDQLFGIVDVNWLAADNLYGSGFAINEATFLAGYLAAGMTQTGVVATYGGIQIPPVEIFMDGFVLGVEAYNAAHGTEVQTLGWDPAARNGLFVGNFESTDDGRTMGESLMDEGADIIMPVAGPVGAGTLAVMEERGAGWIIGVDNDWSVAFASQAEYVLASALKNMDRYVYETIQAAMDGTFVGGNYLGTLDNGGVGLGFGTVEVPAELKAEIDALVPEIVAGNVATLPVVGEEMPMEESTLGTEEDPIIWAVVPSGETERVVTGFEQVAEMIFAETGLVIEPFVATEYAGVIEAMCSDPAGAHMASLATFSYILAADRGCAEAALVSVRFGSAVYNGQIFVRADSGIETLADLAGKTFCRPDPLSTSGWIIPSIELKAAGIDPDTDLAQIVDAGSHDASVAGVYNGDCDAGSSYVDARGTIEEDAPDVMDVLTVISISADIPNDGVQFVTGFNADLQAQVVAALLAIAETEEGVNALGEAYSWGALEAHDDTFYDPFRQVLDAAGVSAGDF